MTLSLYEERLEMDLKRIRDGVGEVAERVEQALENATRALLGMDTQLAYQTILGDHPINRSIQKIDRLCHAFVARHLPSAGHLRFISSVLRMNVELERIGDYAVTICRETVQLSRSLDTPVRREAERLARDTSQMLHQALQAFKESNANLAKGTMSYAEQISRGFSVVFEELIEAGRQEHRTVEDLFRSLVIFNRLERVSDQAKNICEETVFAVTGEMKQPKVYRILFLDVANDYKSQMAVAIARKAYPESGDYTSAGLKLTKALSPTFVRFMEDQGVNWQDEAPRTIDWAPEQWADFHVLVSMEGSIKDYISVVPFRTAVVEWKFSPAPKGEADGEKLKEHFEELYRQIAYQIRGLMETLRGKEAS